MQINGMGAQHSIQQDPTNAYLQLEQLKFVKSAQGKKSTAGFGQLGRTTCLIRRYLATFFSYGTHTIVLNSPIPVPGITIFPISLEMAGSKKKT